MKPGPSPACRPVRELLVARVVAGRPGSDLPPPATEHLRSCPACRRYHRGLQSTPALFDCGPLYSPSLRRNALMAVASADQAEGSGVLPFVAAGAVISLALSLGAPVCVLARLLDSLIGSWWMSLATSLALCSSLGLAAVVPGLATLIKMRSGRPVPMSDNC